MICGPRWAKDDEVVGTCGLYESDEKCVQYVGGQTERKEALGRAKYRWKNTFKICVQEMGQEVVDWVFLVFVNTVLNYGFR